MPVKGAPCTIMFSVWNTQSLAFQTNDADNITLRMIKDGVSAETINSPTEVTNGEYCVDITADENDCDVASLVGETTTANCIVVPSRWQNWQGGYLGSGASSISLYVKDGSTVFPDVLVSIGTIKGLTDEAGKVIFNLDDGTYIVTLRSSPLFTAANSYTVVVTDGSVSSPAGGILSVTASIVPDAISAGSVLVYSDEYDPVNMQLVGEGDRIAYIVRIDDGIFSPSSYSHYHAMGDKGSGAATNANGRWSMSVPEDSEIVIRIYDVTTKRSEGWKVTVPSGGPYSLWQLSPEEVSLTKR